MYPTRKERLAEIFRRLAGLPPARSFREAWRQLAVVMNKVEDEMSGIPFDPGRWRSDGRLYPPQLGQERRVAGMRGVRVFRSVGHRTYIGRNGALEIRTLDGSQVFQKAGADGSGVGL